jgi:hypothetical protein
LAAIAVVMRRVLRAVKNLFRGEESEIPPEKRRDLNAA